MEPKNCVFCGTDFVDVALEKSHYSGIANSYVFCLCGARGPIVCTEEIDYEEMDDLNSDEIDDYMVEKAIAAWNKRVDNGKSCL